MSEWAATLMVGALFASAYLLLMIDGKLARIIRLLEFEINKRHPNP